MLNQLIRRPFHLSDHFPFFIGLVSVIYGALTPRTLRRRRQQFEALELESHSLLLCDESAYLI